MVDKTGLVTIMFRKPGTYYVQSYQINGQVLSITPVNGPALFTVTQSSCPDIQVSGLQSAIAAG